VTYDQQNLDHFKRGLRDIVQHSQTLICAGNCKTVSHGRPLDDGKLRTIDPGGQLPIFSWQIGQLTPGCQHGEEQTQKCQVHPEWFDQAIGIWPIDASGCLAATQKSIHILFYSGDVRKHRIQYSCDVSIKAKKSAKKCRLARRIGRPWKSMSIPSTLAIIG
jgi:hypothetical protein